MKKKVCLILSEDLTTSKSFCSKISEEIISGLNEASHQVEIINLVQNQFNPVMNQQELESYKIGKVFDPLVEKFQKQLTESQEWIFVFTVWWLTAPAILKGFFDKVK